MPGEKTSMARRGRFYIWLCRCTIRPLGHLWTYTSRAPGRALVRGAEVLFGLLVRPPKTTRRTPVRLPHCPAEVIQAEGVAPADGSGRVILYFHGSGFVVGGLNSHAPMLARLSRHAEAPVLSVGYRLAAEAPISTAVRDCLDGYRWLLERGYRPEQIVVAGDSAGGYFAFMVPLALIESGEPVPAGIAAISPVTELEPGPRMGDPNHAKYDVLFSSRMFPTLHRIVAAAETRFAVDGQVRVLVEPTRAELSSMPPTIIHAAEQEILMHDSRLMAEKLAAAGVSVRLRTWPTPVHVFQFFGGSVFPESEESLAEIGRFVRERTRSLPAEDAG